MQLRYLRKCGKERSLDWRRSDHLSGEQNDLQNSGITRVRYHRDRLKKCSLIIENVIAKSNIAL